MTEKMRLNFIIIVLLLSSQFALAQSENNSIDIKFKNCIDTNFTSYDMLMCIDNALYEWNNKLDIVF